MDNMKKLGFGLMRLPLIDPTDPSSVDINTTSKMVDAFIERGFTYFDTAWMYCSFESENAVKKALCSRHSRDTFTLATKLHAGFVKSPADFETIFSKQLEKTGAGYFDYYLLHDLSTENYEKCTLFDAFSFVKEKKAKGLIRHIGFSFHDSPELLDEILTKHPYMEFVQLQINYLDWNSPAIRSRECYEVARKHGKPIIVMEPVKGGTLAKLPDEAEALLRSRRSDMTPSSWALRFAASLDGVAVVLSGMSNERQLDENTSLFSNLEELSDEEYSLVMRAGEIFDSNPFIPCTGCAYCVDGCPKNIPIPKYFSLYNADKKEAPEKGWTPQREYYDNLTKHHGAASDCIECGQCQGICPQHLKVEKYLKEVAEYFGK